MCQFPHVINNRDIHYCQRDETTSDYMCPTLSNGNQICVKGKRLMKNFLLIFDFL